MEKSIILLIHTDNDSVVAEFRSAMASLRVNMNDSTLLVLQTDKPNPNKTPLPSVVYFSEKEFNIFGTIKNESVKKVLEKKYELMIVNGDYSKKIQRLLRKIAARRSVSVNANNLLLTINMKTESTKPDHLLNFVAGTLSKIN